MTVTRSITTSGPRSRDKGSSWLTHWIPRTRAQRQTFLWGLFFTAPAIIGLVAFTGGPIITSAVNSFTNANLLGGSRDWIGWDNYRTLFADGQWWLSLGNTLFITVISVPLGIAVALGLALLLNWRVRGLGFYRVVFFVPSIVPIVASAVIWAYVLNPQYGVINNVLGLFGIQGPGWLSDPDWSKPALILFGLWGVGNLVVILLAGLQGVPQDLLEQASLDGAGTWQQFRNVTLPFISPQLLFATITGLIAGFQYFTQAFVMTGGYGDPAGSTLVSGVYLYQSAFYHYQLGYSSAVGWVLFVIIAAVSILAYRIIGRRVYYGGEAR
ncbi:sugar ABC transporter permease [Curtobacterium sp. PhB146]|uniref:carbohydrate ABC transporter permease n=1 Tax=Curtobacterium sp. PhB146 TaxID=2485187 RepID=UPI0010D2EC9E|nr:sugar ABC transporter permease [Curtobacterium sp. PhB146]TCU48475.1 carbohydrate ABC transporter membrane protein 1 (CUT1 family) [Curtobacterium sp. PhB146]